MDGTSFLFGAVVAVLTVAAIVWRVAPQQQHAARLSRLEGKLDALLKHEGIQFDPYADVPPAVLDAVRSSRKIEAIKACRAATGAGLAEAKSFVEELQRRASLRH
jgi:ribosomal protein L7/L12